MATIPEMLTLRQAAAKTGLSYDYLRKLCLQKKIIFIRAGNKYLINMEKLAAFLNGEDVIGVVSKTTCFFVPKYNKNLDF